MTDEVLYVGDLHPQTTLDDFATVFSEYGGQLIRVSRAKSGNCYALLRFPSKESLNLVLRTLQNVDIHNRPVRLMRFQPDPRLRNVNAANVFVGNIDRRIPQNELMEFFQAFGEVLSCKIVVDDMQNSCGYGYVQFSEIEAAQRAINASGTLEMLNKKLIVKPFRSLNERYPDAKVLPFTNCYVKNLDANTTERDLWELFGGFGEIRSIFMPRHQNTVFKGYAFVCFSRFEEAMRAVLSLNGAEFKGRKLYVGRAEKKVDREKALTTYYKTLNETTICVKNLDANIDDKALHIFFSPCGKVLKATVIQDEWKRSKGVAIVWFQSPEDATAALRRDNEMWGTRQIQVSRSEIPLVFSSRHQFEN